MSGTRTANSSPPRRASIFRSSSKAPMREATTCKVRSPVACPNRSLISRSDVRHQNGEFVAAKTRQHLPLVEQGADARSNDLQGAVARGVPEQVVDLPI